MDSVARLLPIALVCLGQTLAHAHECDAILIPRNVSFEKEVRTTLDTISLIESSEAREEQSKLAVEAYGIPLEFSKASKLSKSTLSYFNQHMDHREAISNRISEIPSLQAEKWADCMIEKDRDFELYFNNVTITENSATLWVKRFITGKPRISTIKMIAKGGYIKQNNKYNGTIEIETDKLGWIPFEVKRVNGQSLTVDATLDNGKPKTAVVSLRPPPPSLPDVSIQVVGHLQAAQIDLDFGRRFEFHVHAPGGIAFNTNYIGFNIIQKVDGRVCDKVEILSGDMGDSMSSNRQWRTDHMSAGCLAPHTPIGTYVQCYVDPLFFTECKK